MYFRIAAHCAGTLKYIELYEAIVTRVCCHRCLTKSSMAVINLDHGVHKKMPHFFKLFPSFCNYGLFQILNTFSSSSFPPLFAGSLFRGLSHLFKHQGWESILNLSPLVQYFIYGPGLFMPQIFSRLTLLTIKSQNWKRALLFWVRWKRGPQDFFWANLHPPKGLS